MPRIRDHLNECVVYLFGSLEDAHDTSLSDPKDFPDFQRTPKAASGVLVEVFSKNRPHQYVVTNRHVVHDRLLVKPRFSFKDPTSDYGYTIDAVLDEWYCNILSTDLAVLPIRDRLVRENAQGLSLLPWSFPTTLHIGDEVAMIGRFYPASGGAINRPVARFGKIARWPTTYVHLDWISDDPVEVILAEMRSHSGYSGSPTFAFGGLTELIKRGVDHTYGALLKRSVDLDWQDMHFLGIDCGHIAENMAAVIPWSKVIELVESPILQQQRDAIDQQLDQSVPPDSSTGLSDSMMTHATKDKDSDSRAVWLGVRELRQTRRHSNAREAEE